MTVTIMEFVLILTAVITVMIVNQASLEKEHHVKVRSFTVNNCYHLNTGQW